MADRRLAWWARPLRWLLVAGIHLYRATLSPLVGGHCRFVPTCSQYGLDAIHEHGPVRGGWMTIRRLLRCHPLAKGGYDPVPPASRDGARRDDGFTRNGV